MSKNVLDHRQAFDVLLEHCEIEKFFEFGLGAGTEYFLQHCLHVTSVELSYNDDNKWFNRCKAGYHNYENWDAHFFALPENICSAERAIRAGEGATVYGTNYGYLEDLQEVVHRFVPERAFDLVFVDPGIHLRADIVNVLFDRVKIIVVHDTNQLPDYYGWERINTPHNYKRVDFPTRAGVVFFVHHTRGDIVRHLKGAL